MATAVLDRFVRYHRPMGDCPAELAGQALAMPNPHKGLVFLLPDGRKVFSPNLDPLDAAKSRLRRKLFKNFERPSMLLRWKRATFATLTFDTEHYPAERSAAVKAGALFREFMNRLKMTHHRVKNASYFAVVEHGLRHGRVHIHFCMNKWLCPGVVQKLWHEGTNISVDPCVSHWEYRENPDAPSIVSKIYVPAVVRVRSYITKYCSKGHSHADEDPEDSGAPTITNPKAKKIRPVTQRLYYRPLAGRKAFTSRDFVSVGSSGAAPVLCDELDAQAMADLDDVRKNNFFVAQQRAAVDAAMPDLERDTMERHVKDWNENYDKLRKEDGSFQTRFAFHAAAVCGKLLKALARRIKKAWRRGKWKIQQEFKHAPSQMRVFKFNPLRAIQLCYKHLVKEGILRGFAKLAFRKAMREEYAQEINEFKGGVLPPGLVSEPVQTPPPQLEGANDSGATGTNATGGSPEKFLAIVNESELFEIDFDDVERLYCERK